MKFYIKETVQTEALKSPFEVYQEFKELCQADQESLWVIGLDKANRTIYKECLFLGGIDQSIVDVKLVFRRLLTRGCSGFICIHNHPGGSVKPSDADIQATKKLADVGKIIDLPLLDHIIIGDGYCSMKEEGILF